MGLRRYLYKIVIKKEDSIHLRAVKYGYERPNGFLYKDIQRHYSKREKEWEIVKEFLHVAENNKSAGLNHVTPYILLKRNGTYIENCLFNLSYEAYFNYLDYLELVESRKNAKSAFWTAIIAILISIVTLGFSIYFSLKSIHSSIKIDSQQLKQIINHED